jgi:hypothetical protein
VADVEPEALKAAAPFMLRHGAAFLTRLSEHREVSEAEFNAIDAIGFRRSFDRCLEQAQEIIGPLLGSAAAPGGAPGG